MTVSIEDALVRHLDRLYEIEAECFGDEAFTREQIARLLREYNSVGLVARIGDTIVGFVIGMVYVDRKVLQGHILTIDVSPAYRRRGTGRLLLQEIETIFRRKGVGTSYLEVREDNVAAIGLYGKMGYERIGKLKDYYGSANGLYFRKTLTKS